MGYKINALILHENFELIIIPQSMQILKGLELCNFVGITLLYSSYNIRTCPWPREMD